MMEEIHSIFACGAGAVTKLVARSGKKDENVVINRIFTPKYPYEYLRDCDGIRLGDESAGKLPIRDRIYQFYKENKML